MPRNPLVLIVTGLLAFAINGASASAEDAKAIAVKVTNAGAVLFDARDSKGLSLTYAEDARLEIISRDKDTGDLKTETRVGRAEIEAYYQQHFKSDSPIHARNQVEYARLLDPDLLTISGIFEPNTESSEAFKLPFNQVRARQNGEWRIVSLQLFIMLQK